MKKNLRKFLATSMVCTFMLGTTAIADTQAVPVNSSEVETSVVASQQKEASYIVYSGTVAHLTELENGIINLLVEGENSIIVNLSSDVVVLDANDPINGEIKVADLEEGMEISCLIPANSPMGMSYPPVSGSVNLVVVNAESKFFDISIYDESLANKDKTLVLNIGDDTVITALHNTDKELTAEDVKNSMSVVFYSATTRSIPAQTTPEMVVVLDEKAVVAEEVKYVALREEAESLGYSVIWTSHNAPILIEGEDYTLEVAIGEVSCQIGDDTFEFVLATKLEGGKTYVSSEILDLLNK